MVSPAMIDNIAWLATLGCAGIGAPGMSLHVLTLNAISFGMNFKRMDCVYLPEELISKNTIIGIVANAVFLSLIWFHFATLSNDHYLIASLGMRLVLDGRFILVLKQLLTKEE